MKLTELDHNLREFVSCPEGVVVNAGPGTGKTFALRQRANFLITDCGVDPKDIFYVTFIRGIATEFRKELEDAELRQREELCDEVQHINVGTFHGLALRHLAGVEGAESRAIATLFDNDHRDPVLDDVIAMNQDAPFSSRQRLQLRLLQHYATGVQSQDAPELSRSAQMFEGLCERYQVRDISMAVAELLRLYDESCDVFVNTLELSSKHFLFDEFQDFNPVEQAYVEVLCRFCSSYRIVGDVDQSIYGWRYVNSRAVLEAAHKLDAETVAFDTVRRCPPEVVAAANTILASASWDRNDLPPQLTAGRERSELLCPWLPPLIVIRATTVGMIARAVAHILSRLVDEYAKGPNHPSVLVIHFGKSDPSAKIQQELDKRYGPHASSISPIRGPGKRDAPEVETLMLLADLWSERAKPYHWRKLLALLAKNAPTQCTQAVLATLGDDSWTDATGYVRTLLDNLRTSGCSSVLGFMELAASAEADARARFLAHLDFDLRYSDLTELLNQTNYHERRESCGALLTPQVPVEEQRGLKVEVVKQTQVKGMTRDIVILYDCRKSFWEKDGGNVYEYQRVNYVCITRASKSLILTVADNYRGKGGELLDGPAGFVETISQLSGCRTVHADKNGVAWTES